MSCTIVNNIISITRGDTLWTTVELRNKKTGQKYTPVEEDAIRFALKKTVSDPEPLIVKEIPYNTLELLVTHEETKQLEVGSYVYDIEITLSNGFVDTFIGPAAFNVTPEVY